MAKFLIINRHPNVLTDQYQKNFNWWIKQLAGKTDRIITTLDQPRWHYRLTYCNARSKTKVDQSDLQFRSAATTI